MSTSATIEIDGLKNCLLYKHYDGDKAGVLPWLQYFNDFFVSHRKSDPEYKMAQLIRSSERLAYAFKLDDCPITGWGVVPYETAHLHEYHYIVGDDFISVTHRGETEIIKDNAKALPQPERTTQ